ncbi:MAG TPA: ATP-binding protein [Syntrophobacteraceae bacterium]|nr:ATP-binding protein [Syntrophobacteraceae bacterium]
MVDSWSMAPVWFTDVGGSALMILLSLGAVVYAVRLVRVQPSNVLWTYLLWLTAALCGFALSRGVGHIAKRLLLLMEMPDIWAVLKPYSGSFNTLAFAVVAAITFFFQRVHRIHTEILRDQEALERASAEVMRLNLGLESLVEQRTHELSRSERRYRRIFEGSMDMIFVLDAEARFVDINGAGVEALGYSSPEEVVGKVSFEQVFACRAQYGELMGDLSSRGYVQARECTLVARDGSERFILLSATVRKDDRGRVQSFEGIAKDVTARVHMQRQLQQADKLASLGQISTGIAHEINNPLGIMLGYTQLLLRDMQQGSQLHDDLKTIEKHARNCKVVVEDLLKFARGTRTRRTSVNVGQCLREVLSLLAHQFELDNIRIQTEIREDLPELRADGEKLKQVFMNLLMNAKQAISQSGTITVRTRLDPREDALLVSISDDGCGISPENLFKIFDPFFTTKPVGEGTGLGLSVSYGIIQDHQGRIDVSSRPGRGSTFTVVLPVSPPANESPGSSPVERRQP